MNKLQLAEKIAGHLPVEIIKAEFTSDPDKRNYIVSYDKISNLGFAVKVTMEEGIEEILLVLKVMDFEDNYTNARYF